MPLFPTSTRPSVFIGSSTANEPFAAELQAQLAKTVNAHVWSDHTFFAGGSTLEVLHAVVRNHEFAVCVFGEPRGQGMNHNVAIELGMFLSTNGAGRTFIVILPTDPPLVLPSNLAGVTYVAVEPELSREAGAKLACRRILSAIEAMWKSDSGYLARGGCWHSSYSTWTSGAAARNVITPYAEEEAFGYELEDAVIFDHQSFVTFRCRYSVEFAAFRSKGQFFGRGRKHNGIAHIHYVGTDDETNNQFVGELLAEITANFVSGIFITKDIVKIDINALSIGGFKLKVQPKPRDAVH